MREIKFRVWDQFNNQYWYLPDNKSLGVFFINMQELSDGGNNITYQQFTGLKDKNGKEIYEGDIKRETIEEDEGDVNLYYACTWIKEWSMFGWLSKGELINYQDNGAKGLDTEMYWTYPVDEEEANDTVITGNIYENPDLLK